MDQTEKLDKLLDQLRRILILAVGLIEDYRGIERTIKSHNERRKQRHKDDSIDAT